MSCYCALEVSRSREEALSYRTLVSNRPAKRIDPSARPLEEFYGKNLLPLLWLPLFAPADVVKINPSPRAQFKRLFGFVPDHSPEPFHVWLTSMDAALERFDRQSVRLLSLIEHAAPHPDVHEFCESWKARLERHVGQWLLFEPGDIFPFVEGDEVATVLTDTLKTIAADAADPSAELAVREMMGCAFTNPYGLTGSELVQYWYHELAGGIHQEPPDWPPEPTQSDLIVAFKSPQPK